MSHYCLPEANHRTLSQLLAPPRHNKGSALFEHVKGLHATCFSKKLLRSIRVCFFFLQGCEQKAQIVLFYGIISLARLQLRV